MYLTSCTQHHLKPAPAGHHPILENDRTRVMEVILPPGEKVPLHNHDLPAVIIVHQTSQSTIRDATGKIVSKATPPRGAYWTPAHGPHYSIQNTGNTTMHLYRIELK
ncbi:MAG: hypothetical protein ACSHX6_03430 [Akkermansiaceae bacterium]